jgi:hypothetical protein
MNTSPQGLLFLKSLLYNHTTLIILSKPAIPFTAEDRYRVHDAINARA